MRGRLMLPLRICKAQVDCNKLTLLLLKLSPLRTITIEEFGPEHQHKDDLLLC